MNKTFMKVVKRQAELAAKAAHGEATAGELAELSKLTAAIQAATNTDEGATTTELKTMTLAEYQQWHEKAIKSIEDGQADSTMLALVKRNLAAVKTQGKSKSDDVIAVEMPVEKTEPDRMAALEQRLADVETKLAPLSEAKQNELPATAPATGAALNKPISSALAMEAIDTMLAKYAQVKTMIESGNMDAKKLYEIWGNDWDLKHIIEQACTVMAKSAELNKASESVIPALEKMSKEEPVATPTPTPTPATGDAPATEEPAAQVAPQNTPETPAPEGDKPNGEPAEKGAPQVSRWQSGLDIAPSSSAKDQHKAIKANTKRYGY